MAYNRHELFSNKRKRERPESSCRLIENHKNIFSFFFPSHLFSYLNSISTAYRHKNSFIAATCKHSNIIGCVRKKRSLKPILTNGKVFLASSSLLLLSYVPRKKNFEYNKTHEAAKKKHKLTLRRKKNEEKKDGKESARTRKKFDK